MSLVRTKLYKKIKIDLGESVPDEELTSIRIRSKLKDNSITYQERYKLNSFLSCRSCVQTFTRLKRIREMMNRSLYRRKGESKKKRVRDWMAYNYQIYTVVYQSVLEVAVLLANAVLDLGYTSRQCNYWALKENRRVKASKINSTLHKLYDDTLKHREAKNKLVHQGKSISLPLEYKNTKKMEVDFSVLTQDFGSDEMELREFFEGFIAEKQKLQFIRDLELECNSIESNIEKLFEKLLPQYIKIHSFYKE